MDVAKLLRNTPGYALFVKQDDTVLQWGCQS